MKARLEDERKEQEIASYSPWGKGGGGAPHRNADGSVMRNVAGASRKMVLFYLFLIFSKNCKDPLYFQELLIECLYRIIIK
jgi:hypothetical protein